jgi:hypothetical protein
MTAALSALKGLLKLDPKLSTIANKGKKKGNNKDKKKKNKKNTSNQHEQKKDEAWKKEPPKDGEKHEKQVGKYTYQWCEHHMTWMVHKPANCLLGKQYKAWLGILIFGSDFSDPHCKWNSDSVFDSKNSGRIFVLKFRCLESQKLGIPICDIWNSSNFFAQEFSTSYCC